MFTAALVSAAVGAGAGFAIARDRGENFLPTIISTAIVLLITGTIFSYGFLADRFRPFRTRRFSKRRNTVEVRFRNAEYAVMVAEANAVEVTQAAADSAAP